MAPLSGTVRLDFDLGTTPNLAWGSDPGLGVQALDIFRIQPDASVADVHSHAPRDIGAVECVLREAQREPIMTKRIIWFAARNHMISFAVAFEMLLIDIIGDDPGRVPRFCHHGPYPDRSLPVETAEADWEGIYYCGAPAAEPVRRR